MKSPPFNVAALYIDPRGPYPALVISAWDKTADATRYAGPYPVVAHPPCSAWSKLWGCKRTRRKPGQGDTTGRIAVAQVRRWGGVLEQPAYSRLFDAGYIPRPGEGPDLFGGESFQIDQSDFGHPAIKPTWLYVVRATSTLVHPLDPPPSRRARVENLSNRQKFLTPKPLALALIALALSCTPS